MMPGTSGSAAIHRTGRRIVVPAIAGTLAAHVGVIAMLATLDIAPRISQQTILMVRTISATPPPEFVPSRPKSAQRISEPQARPAPPPQPQRLATAVDAPERTETPPLQEMPNSPPAAAPAHSSPAVSEPRFDADYLQNPAPSYPALSRRMGEEGKVVLRVFVEPNGLPSQVEIKLSSGWPRLDQAAQDTVRRWKFISARSGDTTVGSWVQVPIIFNLRG